MRQLAGRVVVLDLMPERDRGHRPQAEPGYLGAVDACVAEATCAELVVAAVFNTCDNTARAALGASAAATALCDGAAEAAQMCSRPASTVAGCLSAVKIFSDSSLTAARACLDRSCDQHADCVADALGVALT